MVETWDIIIILSLRKPNYSFKISSFSLPKITKHCHIWEYSQRSGWLLLNPQTGVASKKWREKYFDSHTFAQCFLSQRPWGSCWDSSSAQDLTYQMSGKSVYFQRCWERPSGIGSAMKREFQVPLLKAKLLLYLKLRVFSRAKDFPECLLLLHILCSCRQDG